MGATIRIIILGLVLLMFSAPAMAYDNNVDIFGNGIDIEGTVQHEILPVDGNIVFEADYYEWDSSQTKNWNIIIYKKIGENWIEQDSLSGTNDSAGWTATLTQYNVELDEVYLFHAYAYIDDELPVLVGTGSAKVGSVIVTPEPMTLAMTAMGILLVIGFVYKRKEE